MKFIALPLSVAAALALAACGGQSTAPAGTAAAQAPVANSAPVVSGPAVTVKVSIDQLETLPPVDWCRGYGGESFKSMEFTGGDVTAIFVRYGARFFECHDLHTRHHRELIGDVIARFCLDAPLNSAH